MSVIGFNFTKILVEKTAASQGKINISSNVNIKDVQNAKIDLGGAASAGLRFSFAYASSYAPQVGSINLEGEIIVMDDKKNVEDILKSWDEKKQLPEKVMKGIYNTILQKCSVQALVLSRDVNLPSPIPIPKVNITAKKDAKK